MPSLGLCAWHGFSHLCNNALKLAPSFCSCKTRAQGINNYQRFPKNPVTELGFKPRSLASESKCLNITQYNLEVHEFLGSRGGNTSKSTQTTTASSFSFIFFLPSSPSDFLSFSNSPFLLLHLAFP